MNGRDSGLPLEHFIQAVTSQLDRAQETMALKARAGMPLTFAVKDLSLELRTYVEMSGAEVRIRPAGPGEADTSVLHLALTTITRPMMEENTLVAMSDHDEPSLEDVLPDVSDDERRRLEWAGIRTVSQLRQVQRQGGEEAIRRVSNLPVDRLRSALARASQPRVDAVVAEPPVDDDGSPLLRIRGRNLRQEREPAVRIGDEALPVIRSTERELIVRSPTRRLKGVLEVETQPGLLSSQAFALDEDGVHLDDGHAGSEDGDEGQEGKEVR